MSSNGNGIRTVFLILAIAFMAFMVVSLIMAFALLATNWGPILFVVAAVFFALCVISFYAYFRPFIVRLINLEKVFGKMTLPGE